MVRNTLTSAKQEPCERSVRPSCKPLCVRVNVFTRAIQAFRCGSLLLLAFVATHHIVYTFLKIRKRTSCEVQYVTISLVTKTFMEPVRAAWPANQHHTTVDSLKQPTQACILHTVQARGRFDVSRDTTTVIRMCVRVYYARARERRKL